MITMVYEIRASADMIRANCLFSAVGWKEWGRKKDRKRLFPTTPPASSLKRGFAQIISAFAPQCTILLVTRVFFNFTTEREKGRENLFLLQVYMLAVPRVLTFDHQVFYKIFRILCNGCFSKKFNFFNSILIKVVRVW